MKVTLRSGLKMDFNNYEIQKYAEEIIKIDDKDVSKMDDMTRITLQNGDILELTQSMLRCFVDDIVEVTTLVVHNDFLVLPICKKVHTVILLGKARLNLPKCKKIRNVYLHDSSMLNATNCKRIVTAFLNGVSRLNIPECLSLYSLNVIGKGKILADKCRTVKDVWIFKLADVTLAACKKIRFFFIEDSSLLSLPVCESVTTVSKPVYEYSKTELYAPFLRK